MKLFRIWFIGILLFCVSNAFGLNETDRLLINAIKKGDKKFIEKFIEKNSDYNCELSNGKTGLYYAIKYNEINISWFLLKKGADPNLIIGKYSTLVWAIKFDRKRIVRFLIEFGADVNHSSHNGNTPLIYASTLNMGKLCKILIDRGANPLIVNHKNNIASDYVADPDSQRIKEYLTLMEEKYKVHESTESMHDGPYIYWESEEQIVLTYYEKNQNLTRLIEKTIYVGDKDTIIKGIESDKNTYHIKHKYNPNTYKLTTEGDIFAIGDIHGRYDALINLLTNNKIIDANKKWNFGKGHLIFLGDLFDRGNAVTETLWFLHELKFNAQEFGGDVHVLLGNHEIMALTGDHRYLNDKYYYFTHFTYTNYFQLYGKNTVIGRWLRNQNIIMQINDYLFLHAGISPEFDSKNYTYDALNSRFQNYLNFSFPLISNSMEEDILSTSGPLWYRGYSNIQNKEAVVPQQFVNTYLGSRKLKKMILGHNIQPAISTSYEGKVVSIDIFINESGDSAQGLMIIGDKIFKCFSDGTKKHIE